MELNNKAILNYSQRNLLLHLINQEQAQQLLRHRAQ